MWHYYYASVFISILIIFHAIIREGNGTPLQYPCLENPMDRGAWWATVHKVASSHTTERLHFHFSLSCIGEGNGNPLQCSCLENPRDRGAWWAAVYGVAQSRARLKRQQQQQQQHVIIYILYIIYIYYIYIYSLYILIERSW